MILERIKEYIDYKNISISAFEKSLGMSNASFSKSLKSGKGIGTDKLENILTIYFDISPDWLLTGEGPMLRNTEIERDEEKKTVTVPKNETPIKSAEGIPLIPISAMAGAFTGEQVVLEYECERFIVPTFKGAEFLISVRGSSMYPKYNSGDIVACKRVPKTGLFFQWNKVYVLDTDQGPLIKRIKPGSDENHVLIVSDNPNYEPFELHLNSIYNVALVLGVIRLE